MRFLYGLVLLLLTSFCFADNALEPISPVPDVQVTQPLIVELGSLLFHDPHLSQDGTISCASCHSLATGGVDRQKVSLGVMGHMGGINAPTVFNSSLNFRQFWDGRALTLFDQADGPINNPIEMASNWKHVETVVNDNPIYRGLFEQAFDNGVTIDNIKMAIVQFEKSLLTPDSRFDQYLKGNEQALNEQEHHGYTLFKTYGCISCHQGVAIGGNMFQKLGVMNDYFIEGKYTKVDLGRFNITGLDEDRHVFKVPSLRNIALTAPYLHDGSAETLPDAVNVMMKYQLGVSAPDKDVDAIVAFLRTLTGKYQGNQL